ncbi:probable tyrosyl-DNA phosphodiesterase isoform X3 [Bicyclus anynana]|uniref:Probable tyrosyl-DNA phosphodiesterase isoform X3 n=1 Tax=Bicyclus anynana TaxID=110368 RepID=A0ABM3LWT7_BICAN|nr:probable tyrosyl-DNA phosphodiesterase isoform X3 [Bicyclus anynana]
MNRSNKRMSRMDGPELKRVRKECSYGVACYRLNPAHLREYSHPHLEAILDEWDGNGSFPIPEQMSLQRSLLTDQLNILLEKKLYEPGAADNAERAPAAAGEPLRAGGGAAGEPLRAGGGAAVEPLRAGGGAAGEPLRAGGGAAGEALRAGDSTQRSDSNDSEKNTLKSDKAIAGTSREKSESPAPGLGARIRDPEYRPVVPPTRRAEAYLPVVRPRGLMRAKHEAAAPHHVFYTAISAAPRTHAQPYSVTFLELLDESLGELRSSLQLNFMVEPGWLLAQYYFAGYSAKKLTILYGEECDDMRQLAGKPHVDAVRVRMATPFGKHHTKLMLLCYEDGSLRVVVSTANLYHDDWDNRTQGVFLVASVPGSHRDLEWGLARVGALLRQHCAVPPAAGRAWPLVAQASSLGSYGPDPKLWLCGEFLQQFSASAGTPPPLAPPPPLQLLYPSLQNVQRSHDGLLGGGCLPYARAAHDKQRWLLDYLYQWRAEATGRSRAMPHIKSYVRARDSRAAFYLLTSANVSKAAWGARTKRDNALRLLSYEAGVLLLPRVTINEDFFSLEEGAAQRLVIPYDLPPTKYSPDMTPWLSDALC